MFETKSEIKYITKNTTREQLVEECRRLKNLVCQLRHKKKFHSKDKYIQKRRATKEWKERFYEKKYEAYKKDQMIWGKNLHIERIRKKLRRYKKEGERKGYRDAMKRITVNHYKVKHIAHFLMKTYTVMEIYGITFKEYAFLLWAGRYDFFNRKDFIMTIGDVDISYYKTLGGLIKRGLVVALQKSEQDNIKRFCLTGTGVDMYNKIAKFTNKFLKSDTGTSDIRNIVQNP